MNRQDSEQLKEINTRLDDLEESMNIKYRKIKTHFKNQYKEAVRQSGYALVGIMVSYIAIFVFLYLDPDKSINEWIIIGVLLTIITAISLTIISELIRGKKNLKEWFEKEEND